MNKLKIVFGFQFKAVYKKNNCNLKENANKFKGACLWAWNILKKW